MESSAEGEGEGVRVVISPSSSGVFRKRNTVQEMMQTTELGNKKADLQPSWSNNFIATVVPITPPIDWQVPHKPRVVDRLFSSIHFDIERMQQGHAEA